MASFKQGTGVKKNERPCQCYLCQCIDQDKQKHQQDFYERLAKAGAFGAIVTRDIILKTNPLVSLRAKGVVTNDANNGVAYCVKWTH